MDNSLTQLGVGAIVALLILDKVLPYISKKQRNGSSGEKSVEFWQATIAATIASAVSASFQGSIAPILTNQTEILREIKTSHERMNESIIRILARQEVNGTMRNASAGS